jgi:hypothetical protein
MGLKDLDNGVMIGPGLFEAMREKFNRLRAIGVPDKEPDCGSTESTHYPENAFHLALTPPSHLPVRCSVTGIGCGDRCVFAGVWRYVFLQRGGSSYTSGMDSVRFGRALGIGARAAAKTLVTAVDAATAPNPAAKGNNAASTPQTAASKAESSGARLGQQAARTTAQVRQTSEGLKRGSKRFGEAVWGPFVKASGQLWLELTGVFFGIFAVSAGIYVWRLRGELHETAANHDAHVHLLVAVAMAAVFGYFCVSSFANANRRGKRS